MKLVYSDGYAADLGSHVFPIQKYRLLKDRLVREGVAAVSDLLDPRPASDDDVLLVHEKAYLKKLKEGRLSPLEIGVSEIPFSPEVVGMFLLVSGGSLLAARTALEDGVCVNLGGGFHHAFADHGEGFCLLNDVAIAVSTLLAEAVISRALIVDCDLHQGNGTAAVFAGRRDVFTFSIHQENNYPLVKQKSGLDIGLADGTGGTEYNGRLAAALDEIVRAFGPDFVIYLAGADPYEGDQLGALRLSKEALKERDKLVMRASRENGIPLCAVLAGGYAWDVDDTVDIHYNTVVAALEIFGRSPGSSA
ncbi:MAG: histone deacetylase [Candidatus Eisenbacteria bacterium]